MSDPTPQSQPDLSGPEVLSSLSIEFEPVGQDFFTNEIKETADKLVRVQVTLSDLKIISRVRGIAITFNVFKPYRLRHKVAMFDSARTRCTELMNQMG